MLLVAAVALLSCPVAEDSIKVFAAASLKDSFTAIARSFEMAHPSTKVVLNFGGSQLLAAQIGHGAPADVFASAAKKNLEGTGFDPGSLRIFAHNRLNIITRSGLAGLMSENDLVRAKRLVIADPRVPVGHYTQIFFSNAGKLFGRDWLRKVESHVVSKEQDVKSVLAKVRLGEADAGVVYVSDATSARDQVKAISIRSELNTVAEYSVAIISNSPNRTSAKDFVKFLLTPSSQEILESNGFISPLRPVRQIEIVVRGHTRLVDLPFLAKLPKVKISAMSYGRMESLLGVSFDAVVGPTTAQTATFVGADGYRRSVPTMDLIGRRAVFVLRPDGNYQLIIPAKKPSTWVPWIRHIELK